MKKIFVMACALVLLTGTAMAVENTASKEPDFAKRPGFEKRIPPTKEQMEQHRKFKEAAFDQKLGLTEVQKLKVKEQRKAGFEKIKPVMEELRAKKLEAKQVNASNLTYQQKEEKLAVIDKEIAELQKKAANIRKQNMKDFESILTKEQKKTLKQMKKDGRNEFHKQHKPGAFPPPPPCPNHKFNPNK